MVLESVFFQILCAGVGPDDVFLSNDDLQAWGGLGVALGYLWAPRVSFMSSLDLFYIILGPPLGHLWVTFSVKGLTWEGFWNLCWCKCDFPDTCFYMFSRRLRGKAFERLWAQMVGKC